MSDNANITKNEDGSVNLFVPHIEKGFLLRVSAPDDYTIEQLKEVCQMVLEAAKDPNGGIIATYEGVKITRLDVKPEK